MNDKIKELLLGDKPCSIGKIGVIELMHFGAAFLNKDLTTNYSLAINAGINCESYEDYTDWVNDFEKSIKNLDAILAWNANPSEAVILSELFNGELVCKKFTDIEPFTHGKDGWHYSLKDKKILVISSFKDSIEAQIPNFSKIWDGAELGSCEVIRCRNPYQITGESPFYYNDEMYRITNEISKRNFDICIVGCGGYSLPICDFVKRICKKNAIHLGGGTQVLFGIRGSRFDRNFKDQEWYGTEHFIRPLESDIPKFHHLVEESCYW